MSYQEILYHCAPTLANLKIGNLFSLKYQCEAQLQVDISEKNLLLNPKGVYVRLLKKGKNTALIYVYRREKLEKYLQNPETQEFLKEFGYEEFSLENAFSMLEKHLHNSNFPHEIGVFLDYPLEDIRGFIQNQGKNYQHSGCWKVYHNPEKAIALFQRYKKCVAVYLECYARGIDMSRLTVVG